MRYLFALCFDTWRNIFYVFHEMVDEAMNVWGVADDQEDQW